MKPTAILRHFLSIASGALLCISCAHAADVTWDITPGTVGIGNGSVTGGSGAWNTSTGNWTTNGGVNNLAWVNAHNDTAIFSGTPGTITLGTGITVGGLIFNTPDYNVAGSTLTFGTAGTITANENATISSVLAGSAISKTGTGTLVLSGNNSYTGTMTVTAGTLSIGDGTTNGTLSGSYLINNPGTLRIRYNTSGVQASWTGTIWNNFTGNGTLALATGKSGDGWGNAALKGDFTGTLQVESGRVGTNLGTGSGFGSAKAIKVLAGGQIMDWMGSPITQDLTIAGTGYGEGGLECAIRMSDAATPSILSGLVNLSANATIGAKTTGILMNVISGAAGSTLTVGTSYCAGTVILSADNTYAGATNIAVGTLQIGNGGATGALGAGAVTNNGTLVFNRSGTVNVAQSITGSGAVKQEGSGTVILAADNTYAGATTIAAGTLQIGNGGATGALGAGAVTNNGTLVFNRSGTVNVAQSITGSGAFKQEGSGTVTLTGANDYLGATTISAGTLSIGDGATNGTLSSSYLINSPGTLRIRYNTSGVQASWTGTIWNNFTGNGTLALATGKSGDGWGSAALTGDFTGTLQIEGGRVGTNLVIGSGFGSAKAIKVLAGGQLMDWMGSAITQDLTIAGTGYGEDNLECAVRMADGATPSILSGLVNLSANATIGAKTTGILTNVISGAAGSTLTVGTPYCAGTVILAADNTYAGATIIAAGTLQIGNSGATGALGAGAVTNNGTLVFNRSGTVNVAQSITGSGAVKQEGSGNVILAGANDYLGATTITAGTLTLGGDGALPTGSAVSIGDATLHAGSSINSAGTLGVTLGGAGPARIIFGSGATLVFANSSALLWPDFLQLGGNFVSGASMRVGTTSGGLTPSQLQRIIAPGFTGFALNAQGYLTATAYTVPNYDSWQMANSTNQSLNEDLDGDGVPNGVEYFLHGTGDSSGTDVFPGVTGSTGNLSATWTKASTYLGIYGTDFVVQTSSTLASGSWTNQNPSSNLVLSGNSVIYNFPAGDKNFARLVVYGTAQEAPLVIDTSNAIPLRSHTYRQDMFAVSLLGSAIKPNNGILAYEVLFDTGSWQTCLPYGALNKANLIVDAANIRTDWGTLADRVRGQFILKSRDGLTNYTANNFTFYALKNEDGSDMADDRTLAYSRGIVGAFPTLDSIVAVLTAKYSTNGLGSGIISESPGGNFVDNWRFHKSYLKFGNDPAVAARLNWYNWKPWFTGQAAFDPIVVPGFKVSYRFPTVSGQTYPDIVMPNLIATIDTGAGDLVMRTGPNNPHLQAPYSQFFNTARVPYWYNPAVCRAVNYGVDINVEFTGSTGKTISYSFPTADWNGGYIPNVATIGNWDSSIPWTPNNADMPTNRINLGNSIYFFCKVYYWDITNQRVGFFFN